MSFICDAEINRNAVSVLFRNSGVHFWIIVFSIIRIKILMTNKELEDLGFPTLSNATFQSFHILECSFATKTPSRLGQIDRWNDNPTDQDN